MRRKETEIPCYRSFEQMAGASEGKGHHRKGLREEDILGREGPWREEASQHLRSLGEKKSVPVVPVFQLFQYSSIPINFETPPFSLIINNYLITN